MAEASPPLLSKLLPARGAATKANTSFRAQLDSSPPPSDVDDHPSSESFGEPLKRKGSTKARYGGKAKPKNSPKAHGGSAKPTPSGKPVSAPAARPRVKSFSRKRPLLPSEPSSSENEDHNISARLSQPSKSDLTPRQRANSQPSRPLSLATPPRFSKPALQIGHGSVPRSSLGRTRTRTVEEDWDLSTLGSLVWVLIDKYGKVIEVESEDSDNLKQMMWWPGKVTNHDSTSLPLRVELFGKVAYHTGRTAEINSPSIHNVQSMYTHRGHALRFDAHDFMCSRSTGSDDVEVSPRKKQKTDIDTRWGDAVNEMLKEDAEENDGLPSVVAAFRGGSFYAATDDQLDKKPSRNDVKGKTKNGSRSSDLAEEENDRWSPPPCDDLLDIPGELILARTWGKNQYYPAKILSYIPPTKPKDKPKYRILFLNEEEQSVPREWFYTSHESGFGNCKMGAWESGSNVHSDEEEDSSGPETDGGSPSPSPILPLPSSTPFSELPVRTQLSYVKPVLAAILNDTYAPAKARHDAYIWGGKNRVALQNQAGSRGYMNGKDVSELRRYLTRWALRKERFGRKIVDETTEAEREAQAVSPIRTSGLVQAHNHLLPTTSDVEPPSPMSTISSITELPLPEEPPSSFSTTAVTEGRQSLSPAENQKPDDKTKPPSQMGEDAGFAPGGDSGPTRSTTIVVPPAPRNGQAPRQTGCAAYEALSGSEKLGYCIDVLLPEAILQILLWRTNERTSLAVLDPQEEKRLHAVGTIKAEERDWVDDVMRLRAAIQRKQKVDAPSSQPMVTGGTRSRPKKSRS